MEAHTHLDHDALLGHLRHQGSLVARIESRWLDAPVPSLEDWTVERVVRHLGKIHRWVAALLSAPADQDPAELARATEGMPRGAAALDAYADALAALDATLTATGPDRPVASFVGPETAAFWSRRQAHELTIHRIDAHDAIHAAGGPTPDPIDPALATDGIAEWLEVFVAHHPAFGTGHHPGPDVASIDLVATDRAAAWHVDLASGSITERRAATTDEASTAQVSGTAAEIELVCWRRRPLDAVRLTGDRELIARFFDTMRF